MVADSLSRFVIQIKWIPGADLRYFAKPNEVCKQREKLKITEQPIDCTYEPIDFNVVVSTRGLHTAYSTNSKNISFAVERGRRMTEFTAFRRMQIKLSHQQQPYNMTSTHSP